MDFVKREDSNIIEEENYKAYMEAVQKTHQMEVTDYQHTAISMEQLHQAMQSSLNASSIVHNFQLPISPRQMSTLMLKSNHITRNLNFNDIPAHLQRNLSISEADLAQPLPNDLPQNLGRHEDLLINQNLARNLDINLARTIANDLELQNALPNSLVQNLSEQELSANLAPELGHALNRINDVNLTQSIVRTESNIPHSISNEVALAHHLNRENLDQNLINNPEEVRRTPDHIGSQNLLEHHLNQRLEQHLGQRLDHSLAQRLDQRLDQLIAQRMVNAASLHEHQRQLETNDHLMNMQFHIKAEQEDDGYFYDNIHQGVSSSNNEINGHIPLQSEHPQTNTTNVPQEVYCVYNNQITQVPALNPIDLYSRPQNYVQNYISNNINRDNPQNLVVHKQFESSSQFSDEFKKLRQDGGGKNDGVKNEEPKENLKPSDQNKMYYDYNNSDFANSAEKNENDASSHNKLSVELAMNIRGEYVCYKCSEIFPSKRALKQHGKICEFAICNSKELTEKQGKFTCSQCAYRCQSPAILKIHERTHSGEKPYSCTFCDYKSGQKNNVAKHILVHMKEKPFRCQYCDYRCAQKNNLVVHERTHTGYKPFACPYCDYRTVQKPNLVKHMYLHTDQKPFSCDMCNYRCVQKTNLTKHKQRHLNEKGDKLDAKAQTKPYRPRQKSVKCPHCAYRCVQKSSLEKHLQFKHTDIQTDFVQLEQGLNLMKHDDELSDVQNLSVKKDQCVQEVLEPLQLQS